VPAVIALLRAVNVGGRNLVNMEELRTLCASLGHKQVQTYLQSGNVVFQSANPSPSKVASELQGAIAEALGVETIVIPRTVADMRAAVAKNPFEGRNLEPSKVMVAFFQAAPPAEVIAKAATRDIAPDELHFAGREGYIYYASGAGKPTLNWSSFERGSKIPATARNWNTTLKLLEMAEALKA
jgi:uncharacterized protein (DUF1697 family)